MAQILMIVFALTVPVFYIVGAASVLKIIVEIFTSSKKNKDKTPYSNNPSSSNISPASNQLLRLYEAAQKYPSMSISSFVQTLHTTGSEANLSKAHHHPPTHNHTPSLDYSEANSQTDSPTIHPTSHTTQTNWFSENTISFFLFVGAILIVVAVAIFVSFQWNLMSAISKLLSIGLFNLAWFIAGSYFYRQAKMRLAGLTFLTLGSLLFPVSVYASHYLVFSQYSTNPGYVMLLGAGLSLGINTYLSLRTKRYWFTYLAGLSLAATYGSLVFILDLEQTYFVVFAILAALSLMFTGLKQNLPGRHQSRAVLESAHAILVLGLSFGAVLLAVGVGAWLSLEVAATLLITAGYIWLCFRHYQHPYFLVGIVYTSSFALISLLGYLGVSSQSLIYILSLLSLIWLVGPMLINNSTHTKYFAVSAIFMTALAYSLNLTLEDNTLPLFLITLIGSVELFISWPLWRRSEFEYSLPASWLVVLIHGLRLTSIEMSLWPFIATVIGAALYLGLSLSRFGRQYPKIKITTLGWVGITGLWAIFHDLNYTIESTNLEFLYGAFVVTILTSAFAQLQDKYKAGWYIVSFQALVFYLWILNRSYYGLDIQFSTLPLGIWILGANYLWKHQENSELPRTIDVVGLAVVLIPSLSQSHLVNQALISAGYGLVLMVLSISLNRMTYRFAGLIALLAAIIIQSADYIMSLPRWLLVGGLGMLILSVGVILLNKRNQTTKD